MFFMTFGIGVPTAAWAGHSRSAAWCTAAHGSGGVLPHASNLWAPAAWLLLAVLAGAVQGINSSPDIQVNLLCLGSWLQCGLGLFQFQSLWAVFELVLLMLPRFDVQRVVGLCQRARQRHALPLASLMLSTAQCVVCEWVMDTLLLQGSATVCLLTVDCSTGMLRSANLGDSGFLVYGPQVWLLSHASLFMSFDDTL